MANSNEKKRSILAQWRNLLFENAKLMLEAFSFETGGLICDETNGNRKRRMNL